MTNPYAGADRDRIRKNALAMRKQGASDAELQSYLASEDAAEASSQPGSEARKAHQWDTLTAKGIAPAEATKHIEAGAKPLEQIDSGDETTGDHLLGAARQLTHGITAGWGDEIGAGVNALAGGGRGKTLGDRYRSIRDQERQALEAYQFAHPTESQVLEMAGSVAPAGLIGGGVAGLAGKALRAASPGIVGALSGGAYGATSGLGSGEGDAGDQLQNAAMSGGVGALFGGALPAIGKAGERLGEWVGGHGGPPTPPGGGGGGGPKLGPLMTKLADYWPGYKGRAAMRAAGKWFTPNEPTAPPAGPGGKTPRGAPYDPGTPSPEDVTELDRLFRNTGSESGGPRTKWPPPDQGPQGTPAAPPTRAQGMKLQRTQAGDPSVGEPETAWPDDRSLPPASQIEQPGIPQRLRLTSRIASQARGIPDRLALPAETRIPVRGVREPVARLNAPAEPRGLLGSGSLVEKLQQLVPESAASPSAGAEVRSDMMMPPPRPSLSLVDKLRQMQGDTPLRPQQGATRAQLQFREDQFGLPKVTPDPPQGIAPELAGNDPSNLEMQLMATIERLKAGKGLRYP